MQSEAVLRIPSGVPSRNCGLRRPRSGQEGQSMTMKKLLGITATLFLAGTIRAQEARLNGTVSDSSGSVLVGVPVTATQTERNLPFTTTTDAEGRYLFPRLPIGAYEIKAEHPGFKA